jgi:enediyne biosynthesis protein E4
MAMAFPICILSTGATCTAAVTLPKTPSTGTMAMAHSPTSRISWSAGQRLRIGLRMGDYDNDGHPDLYLSQYGSNVLYRNHGDGTFTDVTAKAHVDGLDFGAQVHVGAAFFDYDRDGYLDLYAGSYVDFGPDAKQTCQVYGVESSCPPQEYKGTHPVLYHNNRDGTFTNVTKAAGRLI